LSKKRWLEYVADMKTTTTRKNAGRKASSAKRPSTRQKIRQLSWFDRFLRTLPFSESEIQKGFTWIAVGVAFLALIIASRFFGVPSAVHQQYAAIAAKAGFVVNRVETTGMERVDQLKVYGIVLAEKDRAMPLVDLEKIRSDLMQYGWIQDVRVSRRLPDTLVVEITERKPTAIWKHGSKLSLIDSKGVVLENVSVNEANGLPTLNGQGANVQAVALAELVARAPSLKPQISAASWVGNRRWDLTFKTGETLALPEGESKAAEALLNFARMDGVNRLLGRDIIHFDLRDPDRMYLRKAPKADPGADTKSDDDKNGMTTTSAKQKVSA
jgi:cell division protein FtsQ